MFAEMRSALGITKKTDILDHLHSLPPGPQETAQQAIRDIESKAMLSQTPQPGLNDLMSYLDSRSIRKAICTRNFDVPVQNLLTKYLASTHFHPIVTREFRPPKPDPAGIWHIAEQWNLRGENGKADATGLIMVGDSIDDMTAGRTAGAATVLLANNVNEHLADHKHTDLVIRSLDELIAILEEGFQCREYEIR